ncbi:ornithine carbamoyltransferase [Buchnera aphidicola (Ceratoglyphina bambusae)]|uniref:ornithine carbamoyltransferase n=1 Tax=Buchnera aphidicola TaxID=9 RepID=UPI0031B8504A
MENSLYKKSLLSLSDINKNEINNIIKLAYKLKKKKKYKKEKPFLKKKKIILIFELNSTRTRCAFEVAAYDQKANITYLNVRDSHIGVKESIEDTIKIFNNMYDAIQYRGPKHATIEEIKKYSKIPVWNGLTDKFHPTQILSDLLTIKENSKKNKKFSEIKVAYVGDCKNNIANTLLEASYILGININMISNKKFLPNYKKINSCLKKTNKKHIKILCTENLDEGLENVDFIYTDSWVSMNENKKNWINKIKLLKKYKINSKTLKMTNNKKVKILHCLPAIHDNKTKLSKNIFRKYNIKNGLEITDKVFKSKNSLVFKQSENKMHIIKALMILSLKKNIKIKI